MILQRTSQRANSKSYLALSPSQPTDHSGLSALLTVFTLRSMANRWLRAALVVTLPDKKTAVLVLEVEVCTYVS